MSNTCLGGIGRSWQFFCFGISSENLTAVVKVYRRNIPSSMTTVVDDKVIDVEVTVDSPKRKLEDQETVGLSTVSPNSFSLFLRRIPSRNNGPLMGLLTTMATHVFPATIVTPTTAHRIQKPWTTKASPLVKMPATIVSMGPAVLSIPISTTRPRIKSTG